MSKILSLDSSLHIDEKIMEEAIEKVYKDDPDIRMPGEDEQMIVVRTNAETHETSMYYIRLRPIYERARAFACKSGG